MRKITPHLWFDKEAKDAAELYTSPTPNSKITNVTTLRSTPSGDCDGGKAINGARTVLVTAG